MNRPPWVRRLSAVAALSIAVGFLAWPTSARAQQAFLRGDVNTDGQVSLSDSLMLRRWLFDGQTPPPCLDAADVDDNATLNLTDQVRIILLAFNFDGHVSPPAPFPEIGFDPTDDDGVSCAAYEVEAPVETDDLVRIGDVTAVPGQRVEIPVHVTNRVAIEAFQLVIAYNPQSFTPEFTDGVMNIGLEGTFYEQLLIEAPPSFGAIKRGGDGIALVGFVPSLIFSGWELPPGDDVLVFKIPGHVAPDAPAGVVDIVPVNGPDDDGFGPAGIRNELTFEGDARFANTLPKREAGRLEIIGDQTVFVRGDADDNRRLSLGDAETTLHYLFRGGVEPPCFDAADANDDGRLNIADPVATLRFLFMGGPSLPAPYPDEGVDLTPDPWTCGPSTR